MKEDENVKLHINEGPERLGHTILYDTLVDQGKQVWFDEKMKNRSGEAMREGAGLCEPRDDRMIRGSEG